MTESEKAPVTGHGGVTPVIGGAPSGGREAAVGGTTGDTNIGETGGGGLRPALPSSVDPSGIPVRPTCRVDGAGIDGVAPAIPAQALAAPPMPPPSNSGLAADDVGPPAPEQPIVPIAEGAGLMPGVVISVAPNGIPVGPTAIPGPMARGDVAFIGAVPTPPTCAKAALQTRKEAASVTSTMGVFMVGPFM